MVSNGEAEAGRELVDSLVKAARPGSPEYAEGLYWRATLAASARDAEKDYRRIVVDYSLSPRVPDALLRMGELESARGDREAALQHFQRITLEHPESPLHAEASYWVAHTYFETNDILHGCTANADALAQVRSSNVELKNRIAFQQQRCRGIAVAQNAAGGQTAAGGQNAATRAKPAAPVVAESTITSETTEPTTATSAAPESSVAEVPSKPASTTATRGRPVAPKAKAATSRPTSHGYFGVQVAAFKSKPDAAALAKKLRGRGYSAHVDGSVAPYRVRIGRYSTRAAAVAELQRLEAKKISGFVTPE